jgi:hypothetical protein
MIKDCQAPPSQYIKNGRPINKINSRDDKSTGNLLLRLLDLPNIRFTHDLKKKEGAIRYNNIIKYTANTGNKSNMNAKNKNSEMKKIEPGKPRKIKQLSNMAKNNFGHKKLRPLISVIERVLNRRATASTSRNEFVESNA